MNKDGTGRLNHVCVVFALGLFVLSPALGTQKSLTQTVAVAHFHISEKLSAIPEKMGSYKTQSSEVSLDDMERLKQAFSIDAPILKKERQYIVKDGNTVLEVFSAPGTGYVRFSNNEELAAEKEAERLLSEKEAVTKATEFLSLHKLLPDNARLLGTRYYEFAHMGEKGETVKGGKSAIAVVFGFELDGLKVRGPGAKAGVVFGNDTKIIGASLIWRRIVRQGETEIISPEKAFQYFKQLWPPEGDVKKADIRTNVYIEKVSRSYYAKPGLLPQEYLEPVYVFSGYFEVKGIVRKQPIYEKEFFEIFIPAEPGSKVTPISIWGPRRDIWGQK